MRKLIWKLRYSIELRRLLALPWQQCWEAAGAWLEMLNGDLSESPIECAREEYEEWNSHP